MKNLRNLLSLNLPEDATKSIYSDAQLKAMSDKAEMIKRQLVGNCDTNHIAELYAEERARREALEETLLAVADCVYTVFQMHFISVLELNKLIQGKEAECINIPSLEEMQKALMGN